VKKIAYFTNQYPKVSHSFIRREILALERMGYEVDRFALRGWDADVVDNEDIQERSRTRYILQVGPLNLLLAFLTIVVKKPLLLLKTLGYTFRLGFRSDRPLSFHFIYLLEACQLLLWLDKRETDHIHGHFGTNPAEILLLTRKLGGPPYSFTVHGPEEFDKPGYLKLGEKIRCSKFTVAISSFGKSQLFRTVDHYHWDRIREVHCGLEKDFYKVPPVAVPDTRRLVCVGRLCEQKGQLLLMDAAKTLHDKGIDFEIVLAGDGELRGEIESLISSYGLDEKITITGWISSQEVREYLLNSRALVLPSFAEGLPVVIMEAMSLKRPVLSTYIAGIPELVIPGDTGWLFPSGSVLELANAMEACLFRPVEQLQQMGEAGYQRVTQRHDIDTEAGKLADYFNE